MISKYCYICNDFTHRGYDTLQFYKCNRCVEIFILPNGIYNNVITIILSNKDYVNFKKYNNITVYKYDEMNKSLRSLVKKPHRTVLKLMLYDIMTLGGLKV